MAKSLQEVYNQIISILEANQVTIQGPKSWTRGEEPLSLVRPRQDGGNDRLWFDEAERTRRERDFNGA